MTHSSAPTLQMGESFIRLASLGGIAVERTDIEAHTGSILCERTREPINTTVREMLLDHPKSNLDIILAMAVK